MCVKIFLELGVRRESDHECFWGQMSHLKNSHNLYFIWWEVLGFQAQEIASQVGPKEGCSKEERKKSGVCLQERAGSLSIKRLLLIK